MEHKQTWIARAIERFDTCLELNSPGGMSWRFVEDDHLLIIAPSTIEMVGGRDDGESIFPSFHLDVGDLAGVFDEPPQISWSTREQTVSLEGKIAGKDAWIEVQSEPFNDEGPRYNLYSDGSLGEK
jgi:hypothetical protein